ncbi:hypothetical protein ABBQ32_007962 [Trebouxia sp. C0010 RCD-2024]
MLAVEVIAAWLNAGHEPAFHNPDQVDGDNSEIRQQKAIKSFLNKITPSNFDKMLANIIAVGHETEGTASGLVDQVMPHHSSLG